MSNRSRIPIVHVRAKISAPFAGAPHWLHRAIAFSTGIAILGAFPTFILNGAGSLRADLAAHTIAKDERSTRNQPAESRPFEYYTVIVVADGEQATRLRDSFSAAESLTGEAGPERMPFEIVILADDTAIATLRQQIAETNLALAGAGKEVSLVDARH